MTISLGSTAVTGMTLGGTPITGVYLGSAKLWPVASPSGVSVVQVVGVNGGGTKSVTFNAAAGWVAPQVGNLLVAFLTVSSSGATKPANFTWLLNSAATTRREWVAYRIADGTESSVAFGAFGGHLVEISGANASPFAGTLEQAFASSTTFTLGPLTPTAGNCLAIGAAAWNVSNQSGFSADAGWTLVTEGVGVSFSSALAYRVMDASLAPAQVSITAKLDVNGGGSFLLVNPA